MEYLYKQEKTKKIEKKCRKILNNRFITKSDKRYEKAKAFYKKHKFYYEEIWNLNAYIAAFVLPRLIHYRKVHCGTPACLIVYDTSTPVWKEKEKGKADAEWDEILDKMIEAFYRSLFYEELCHGIYEKKSMDENQKIVEEGLKLFGEYFQTLWD